MKQNLGITDRVLRFALAFWWLGPWALKTSNFWVNLVIVIIGIIALIESFIGWCALHTLLNINNKNQ